MQRQPGRLQFSFLLTQQILDGDDDLAGLTFVEYTIFPAVPRPIMSMAYLYVLSVKSRLISSRT